MSLKWLSLKRLQCQMKPTAKNGKRKGKQFYEAERFSNRYPKRDAFLTLPALIAPFCADLLIKV
ncbi:hypothetical protein IMSAGC021_00582 [Muribaculaceae bacterium]|uniref:hypothetical protein n=1 Tax=Parabacteroides distasonis TaxID=823 RepID=UPI000EF71F09|nr:hypothetical protein [Parabacteroides distasonis]NBH90413.1 hypothetical protein [Parabacteroides distasonis]GFI52283.1 hypothetical protein IMSAGC021_00582 [Muribaculaceae bacterium]